MGNAESEDERDVDVGGEEKPTVDEEEDAAERGGADGKDNRTQPPEEGDAPLDDDGKEAKDEGRHSQKADEVGENRHS